MYNSNNNNISYICEYFYIIYPRSIPIELWILPQSPG